MREDKNKKGKPSASKKSAERSLLSSFIDEKAYSSDSDKFLFSGLQLHNESDVFYHIKKPKTVHWAVAWSDLMMTMFIMFAVLYIYQAAHREFIFGNNPSTSMAQQLRQEKTGKTEVRKGHIPHSIVESKSEIIDPSKNILRAEDPEALSRIDLVKDKTVRIILSGDLLFDTGDDELSSGARRALAKVAAFIRRTDYMVNVIGHTDNIPMASAKYPTNWELSALRACTVARFLIENMRLPAERFYVSGYSYYQPLRPNDTLENRAINRRVEVVLTKERPHAASADYEDIRF